VNSFAGLVCGHVIAGMAQQRVSQGNTRGSEFATLRGSRGELVLEL
jgi:hypothetical protein